METETTKEGEKGLKEALGVIQAMPSYGNSILPSSTKKVCPIIEDPSEIDQCDSCQ